jgi:hypothetical protein
MGREHIMTSILGRFLLVPVLFAFVMMVTGCGRDASNPAFTGNQTTLPPGILYTAGNGDDGSTLSVARGDTIDITLQTIGPGQYETPQISTAAVVFVKNLPVSTFIPAGVTQIYQFLATDSGSAEISIPHSAGFSGAPGKEFSVAVMVK